MPPFSQQIRKTHSLLNHFDKDVTHITSIQISLAKTLSSSFTLPKKDWVISLAVSQGEQKMNSGIYIAASDAFIFLRQDSEPCPETAFAEGIKSQSPA